MALDLYWILDEELPARCEANPELACQLGATYQLHITGHDGGDWFIDVSGNGPPIFRPGIEEADCIVTMSSADFKKFYTNPLINGTPLYLQGKIKAQGDPSLFAKFARLLTLPRP